MLNDRSIRLLQYMVKRLPVGITRTTPMPEGLQRSMQNLRALQRIGLVYEEPKGFWFASNKGIEYIRVVKN